MDPSVFVHSHALCESEQVGPRTRVWAFAHVMKGAVIGADCNVCDHAFVESGAVVGDRVTIKNAVQIWDKVVIEDEVFLGPNMIFTNDFNPRAGFKKDPSAFLPTLVAHGATIGANATIVAGVTIGRAAFVGAGAVVTRTVRDHALVVGSPAKEIGWMCACGARLAEELVCSECERRYESFDGGLRPLTGESS